METFGAIADRMPELFGWLGQRGLAPAGAPFFKYNVIDMEGDLDVEVGVPVSAAVSGEGEVRSGMLAAGRYAVTTHVGHPDELMVVTAGVLDWAATNGLEWDMTETDAGQAWGCRLEVYNTDPTVEPDLNKWEVDLAFRLADPA